MTIDTGPAIRAFVEERRKEWLDKDGNIPPTAEARSVIDELSMILTLCDGLAKQTEILKEAMGHDR